jgi:hypothetical protein
MRIIEVMGMNTRVFSPFDANIPRQISEPGEHPGGESHQGADHQDGGTDDHQDVAESHLILEGIPADTLRSEDIGARDE